MNEIIIESGVRFSLNPENLFKIEQWIQNKNLSGIKTVEFIYIQNHDLLLIEAKKSIPNKIKSPDKYQEYISEIYCKFCHSFNFQMLISLNRENMSLSEAFNKLDWSNLNIRFLLIIPDVPDTFNISQANLPCISEMVSKDLNEIDSLNLFKIWRTNIQVINRKTASKMNLLAKNYLQIKFK